MIILALLFFRIKRNDHCPQTKQNLYAVPLMLQSKSEAYPFMPVKLKRILTDKRINTLSSAASFIINFTSKSLYSEIWAFASETILLFLKVFCRAYIMNLFVFVSAILSLVYKARSVVKTGEGHLGCELL